MIASRLAVTVSIIAWSSLSAVVVVWAMLIPEACLGVL